MKRILFTRTLLLLLLAFALLSFAACKSDEDKCIEGDQTACQQVLAKGTWVDNRDGTTYKIVKIGLQIWMAENLNFKTDSSFCYNNDESYCAKYGRLYGWAAAVGKSESECGYGNKCSLPSGNTQGVCPSGWHLPSMTEWETLINAVGGRSAASNVLKSKSGWNNSSNGTDVFGFSALPAGGRNGNGTLLPGGRIGNGNYDEEGDCTNFWSSTEYDGDDVTELWGSPEDDSDYANYVGFDNNLVEALLSYTDKRFGNSVRCVKD